MKASIKKLLVSFILIYGLFLSGCKSSSESENTAFTDFTHQLFCQEVTSSTINLHYTLENPSYYGLENVPISYGNLSTDITQTSASIENYHSALHSFDFEQLSSENQLTYKILDFYLETSASGTRFLLYQEPLSPTIGIHAQLPILLSEFQFYSSQDVDTYLQLLDTTDTYFQTIIEFENAKSEAGLFMADYQAEEVISQCNAFINMEKNNYLYSTFNDRINALPDLSSSEKDTYISTNKEIIETKVFPSYECLIESLKSLMGTGINQKGLCFLPDGKSYYEYLVRQTVGVSDSISTLQKRTKSQILDDLSSMEEIIFPASTSQNTSLLDSAIPSSLLNDLKTKTAKAFPEIPSVTTDIKYVPTDMQEYLSPAFYMIPAIDNYQNNVIYINQGQIYDSLSLYTTLAHEGYPGHLYQTVYFHSQNPDPVRSILDFGGYVEGWATYTEMMAYYMAPISEMEATLMQKNNSLILGLYAYADMGIHYDGWSQTDLNNFFGTYGITDPLILESIYHMIIGTPANYLKYYLGYLEIYDLKKEIAGELQKEFSQTDFHEAVLTAGPAPFDIVKEFVRQKLLPDD